MDYKTIKTVSVAVISPMVGPIITVLTTYFLQWFSYDPKIASAAEPTAAPLWLILFSMTVSALAGGMVIVRLWCPKR